METFRSLFTKRYFAVAQLYLSLAVMFGTWVIYIPTITTKLHMGEGDLGLALFFSALGALIAMPLGRFLVAMYGEGKVALLGVLSYTTFAFFIFWSPTFIVLNFMLFFYGVGAGILQIGMNSVVSILERQDKVSIMSSCHGFFSLGGILSSGFGTVLMIQIGNPLLHISLSAIIVLLLQAAYAPQYLMLKHMPEIHSDSNMANGFRNPLLWGLVVIALCVMVAEGAIADWGGLYLRDVATTPPELVGLGYAGFSLTMTIGRFLGDFFTKTFGAWIVILIGYVVSLFGFLLIISAVSLIAMFGFLIAGLGFSVIVPEVYRLLSNIKGISAATGISFMAGAGFLGFLAGPVALGYVGEHHGLRMSFNVLIVLILIGTISSVLVKRKYPGYIKEKKDRFLSILSRT